MQQSRIHPALAEALAARGYDTLTSVQSAVIEEEADGRDLIVSARPDRARPSPSASPSPAS